MSGAGADGAHVRLELLSQPRYLAGARELVTAIARRLGFGESAAGHVALAVDEALANVMRHGYQGATDKPIWVSVSPLDESGGGIRIVIEDEARQVDPAQIRSRDLEHVRPGGLGVHIIQQVMDETKYERRERCGMRLTLIKRLSGGDTKGPCGDE